MRYFPIVALLWFSISSYAQIGNVQTYENPIEIGTLYGGKHRLVYYDRADSKRQYMLAFHNEQYVNVSDTRVLAFSATQEEFDYFYQFLRDGFNMNSVRSLEVGEELVKTMPPSMGYMNVWVDFADGTSAKLIFSKRQLDKLFGKR